MKTSFHEQTFGELSTPFYIPHKTVVDVTIFFGDYLD
jgi:hypothetical protein